MNIQNVHDLTGLKCPMPIVRLAQIIKRLERGTEIQVTADDLAFKPDVQAWIRSTGNELISLELKGKKIIAVVKKTN